MSKGVTLVELMTVIVILVALVIGGMLLFKNCNHVIGRFDVTGTVNNNPGSRFKGGHDGNAGREKFSLSLKDVQGNIPDEFRSDPMIVNCDSTQCGSLYPGVRVKLSCYEQIHWFSPNEMECRFTKALGEARGEAPTNK